ncbi:DNA-processing protein DprA [Patescibacteria group bacterium]|nr:DNA-processing protein DprA [Patescibacteria group bacterium]MBU1721383.1 DNA-processing protein DprA [Patescibacteria group bacterium]MBU1900909.1 DNA-processing protein DprA [Patescibacteria group bacterium]
MSLSKEVLFSFFPKCTHARYKSLLQIFSSLDQAWQAELDELKATKWPDAIIHEFLSWRDKVDEDRIIKILEQRQIQTITKDNPLYPPLLKEIYDPPICLFVRGNIKKHQYNLAIVGPRKHSAYGKQMTETFTEQLAQAGITIVSGLAYGVDALAHRSALNVGGHTVAVLGGGVNKEHVQPRQNYALAEDIVASGGALISEYPPGTVPTRFTFPKRNRIIAGMSLGTFVIEATESSGSLITAQYALDHHRDIFTIPQNITSQTSIGSNKLIQTGAHPVTCAEDIIALLDLKDIHAHVESRRQIAGTPEEEKILALLSKEPTHIDIIAQTIQLPQQTLSATLTIMEMKGMVKNTGMMYYILK